MKKKFLTLIVICFFLSVNLTQGITLEKNDSFMLNSNQIKGKSNSLEKDWWPMFQHDPSNTGFSQSTGPETNDISWTFKAKSMIYSPVISDERIFLGTENSSVYCLDITGNNLWKSKTTGDMDSSPAVHNGKVFIGNNNGKIFCFDEMNGNLLWTLQLGGEVSSPTIVDEGLIIECLDGHVYCINQESGMIKWQTQLGIAVLSTPVVVEDKIFVRNYCLDINTGSIIWTSDVGIILSSSPSFFEDKIYICSRDEKMYCLDADTGEKLWKFYTGSIIYANAPANAYGNVYVGNAFGFIYCVNATTGQYVWSTKESARAVSSPAICDGKLYIGSVDNSLYCLDAFTGEKIWQFSANNTFLLSSAIADDHVFSVSGDTLYCFGDEYPANADLDCTGSFSFTNVKPGSVCSAQLIISNVGSIGSELDWEIHSFPDWGVWSFYPGSGSQLTPSDDAVIVDITIQVPSEKDTCFTGEIEVINRDNPKDHEVLDVSLSTSMNKGLTGFHEIFINRIINMMQFLKIRNNIL